MIDGLSYIHVNFTSGMLGTNRTAVNLRSPGLFDSMCVTRSRVVSGLAVARALERRYRRLEAIGMKAT